ncbi:MAG TPA: cyclopropane-fatty-acyl-phospholipid synthase family protein [Microvirga sp.]|jgi:cyclopropane-fatty-acyl-phospholipid synthase|nr:cyclopropane-fatty-acyl-phospholipid synthase family protein [Microvirga sp.]
MDDLAAGHAAPLPLTPANVEDVARGLPFAARKALALAAGLAWGSLTMTLPDGRVLLVRGQAPGLAAAMRVHDWSFAARLAKAGDLGLAEGYLRGEWDSPDLTAFIELFARNRRLSETLLPDRPLVRLWQLFRHLLNRNTKGGARRNIHAHYDLGNRFYEAWLDRTMTYSSALFAPGDNDLASAQTRKYRALAEALELKPSHHVLEIGCGWGGFAAFAAEEIGCRVTGLTISKEQYAYAQARIAKAGLSDRVEFKLQDYRDETGTYDRIASIEMFEAVGEAYWPAFFRQMRDRLKAGGRAGLQVITIREESFANYRREIDFIRRYIFPGGMLPSPTIMRDLGARFSVPPAGEHAFGPDYARTLSMWRDRFRAAWPALVPLGFDERFRRLWEYYLAYCEAGFRTGNIDVRQMIFAKA